MTLPGNAAFDLAELELENYKSKKHFWRGKLHRRVEISCPKPKTKTTMMMTTMMEFPNEPCFDNSEKNDLDKGSHQSLEGWWE